LIITSKNPRQVKNGLLLKPDTNGISNSRRNQMLFNTKQTLLTLICNLLFQT
jgi:hypothetical protein